MGQVWTFDGAPATTTGDSGLVTLLEGTTFCICERSGDVRPGAAQGLFVRDTRLISRLELSINGHAPEGLAAQGREPFACTFLSRMPPLPGLADSTLLVVRRRELNEGMSEQITLRNMSNEPLPVTLRLGVGGDFADVFEVKEGRVADGRDGGSGLTVEVDADSIRLSRKVGSSLRGARITGAQADNAQLEVSGSQLSWHAVVPAHGSWGTAVTVTPSLDGQDLTEFRPSFAHPGGAGQPSGWPTGGGRARSCTPRTLRMAAVFAASTEDLGSLRIFDPDHADRAVIAAGAPWFMTIFGRDSLLTSWMVLPLDPSLALGTMRTLASLQGTKVTPATEEEPGKILHEMRFGMQASLWLGGSSVYYGTVDATPLFVMLLGELRRWGLERGVVDELLPHADRALDWIVNYGDRDGDGFVEYGRSTELGLANQGWKDSFDGVTFADGRDRRAADRAGRGPGLRLRRVPGQEPLLHRARGRRRRGLLGLQGAGAQGQVQPGVLDARPRLLRARPGRRQAADRLAGLQHGPLPVDRHRRRGQGRGGRRAPDRARHVLRVRDPDAGRVHAARTTR